MNIEDVESLAQLSKIELSPKEKEKILQDMEGILGYVNQIREVKLDEIKIEPEVYNVWREDQPIERDFSKESILAQFPNSQDGFLKVKKIL